MVHTRGCAYNGDHGQYLMACTGTASILPYPVDMGFVICCFVDTASLLPCAGDTWKCPMTPLSGSGTTEQKPVLCIGHIDYLYDQDQLCQADYITAWFRDHGTDTAINKCTPVIQITCMTRMGCLWGPEPIWLEIMTTGIPKMDILLFKWPKPEIEQ